MPKYIFNPYSNMLHEVCPDKSGSPYCGQKELDKVFLEERPVWDHRVCHKCRVYKKNRIDKKKREIKAPLLSYSFDPMHRITHQEVRANVTYCGVDPTDFIKRKLRSPPKNFDICNRCERLKNDRRANS
jgi:hypothetical protein